MRRLRRILTVLVSLACLAAGVVTLLQKPHLLPPALRPAIFSTQATSGPEPVGKLERDPEHLIIGSFNIQVFGEKKIANPQVMDVLAKLVRQFDVLAIQEVRAKSSDVMPQFLALINSQGAKYDFVIGPRLGRTTSKEQYAVIYDTERVSIDSNTVYTMNDPYDRLHREPLVTRFQARGRPDANFSFTLVNIHTDPDETKAELDSLDDVFRAVQNDGSGEDDVILLGDLNVDDRHLGELGQVPGITWVISGVPTNTRGDKTYDNILFDRQATTEYTGKSGVCLFAQQFGLTREEAVQVSDHCPVWAQFSVRESGSAMQTAARPLAPRY